MKSDVIDLEASLIHHTDEAWLLKTEMQEKVWLPKSSCDFDPYTRTVTLPERLAIDKGLV